MRYFKWFKKPGKNDTRIEVTKDYFSDGDDYINRKTGWTKLPKQFIEEKENVSK